MTEATFSKTDTLRVKGLAIVLMVIHHCFLGPERYEGHVVDFAPLSEPVFNAIALSFKICVAIFVFLTGYGITLSYRAKFPDYDFKARQSERLIARRLISLIGGFLVVFVLAQLYGLFVVHDGRFSQLYGHGIPAVLYVAIDALGLAELFGTPTLLATFWYMSLAILLVFLIPLMLRLYARYGMSTVLVLALLFRVCLPPTSDNHMAYLPNYLFCLTMGIWSADKNLIVRVARKRFSGNEAADRVITCLLLMLTGMVSLYLRQKTRSTALVAFWDGILPFVICSFMYLSINRLPLINRVFEFLGIYSMNIFLVHNFIRVIWYYDFTYSFKHWWLITLVLLTISLAISIVVEWVKKVSGYNRLLQHLRERAA